MFNATQYKHRSGNKKNFSESIWIFQDYSHFTGLAYFQTMSDWIPVLQCSRLLNLILNNIFDLNFRPIILYRFLEFWIAR